MGNKFKGNIALLMTAMIWGSGFIAQKLGMNALPPLAFNGIRQLLASFVLIPFLVVNLKKSGYLDPKRSGSKAVSDRKKKLIAAFLVCGLFMMLGSNLQQVGLVTVSAGKSGFITAMYIIMVPLIGIFFGRKLTAKIVLCCTIAVVGFGLLSLRGGIGTVTQGDWLTLLSALAFALQITAVNRFVDKDNDIFISVLQMSFTGITTVAISLLVESYGIGDVINCLPVILYSTLFPTALGFTLQIVGQKYTDATTASFLMSLESVFSAIFGALFLHESMSPRELLGCALIFVANIIVQIEGRPRLPRSRRDSSQGD